MLTCFCTALVCQPANAKGKCLSPAEFASNLLDWEFLCIGYPYYPNQTITSATVNSYGKLLLPYIDKSKVKNNQQVTEEINKCCRDFRNSKAWKAAKQARENYHAELLPQMVITPPIPAPLPVPATPPASDTTSP